MRSALQSQQPGDGPSRHPGRRATPLLLGLTAAGLFLHGILFLVVEVNVPAPAPIEFPAPFIQFHGDSESRADRLLREQVELFDSAPLFMPSPWNHAGVFRLPAQYPQRPLFEPFPPWIALGDLDVDTIAPWDAPIPEDPVSQTMAIEHWPIFDGFGRGEMEERFIPPTAGTIVMTQLASGQVLRREPIPHDLAELAEGRLWQSASYLVLIESNRLTGTPLLQKSTGITALDQAFLAHLQEPFLTRDLPNAYYRISFQP